MKRGSEIGSERDYFELDRRDLIGRVGALKITIRTALAEIAMLAAESALDKKLSANLARKTRVLEQLAGRLDALAVTLSRAKFPGPIESRGVKRRRR